MSLGNEFGNVSNKLFNSIKQNRIERYRNASTFKKHGDGWLNRLEKINFID